MQEILGLIKNKKHLQLHLQAHLQVHRHLHVRLDVHRQHGDTQNHPFVLQIQRILTGPAQAILKVL